MRGLLGLLVLQVKIVTNGWIRTTDLPPIEAALATELHSLFHPVHWGRQWGVLVLETCSTVRNLDKSRPLRPQRLVISLVPASELVSVRGFEPPAFRIQSESSTRLTYTLKEVEYCLHHYSCSRYLRFDHPVVLLRWAPEVFTDYSGHRRTSGSQQFPAAEVHSLTPSRAATPLEELFVSP